MFFQVTDRQLVLGMHVSSDGWGMQSGNAWESVESMEIEREFLEIPEIMEICGIRRNPRNSWTSTESMEIHGDNRNPRDSLKSMEHMDIPGPIEIPRGVRGGGAPAGTHEEAQRKSNTH